ncbi:MAG: hypothetical protein QW331_04195 [Candidatus Woesearchaeota archaeon]
MKNEHKWLIVIFLITLFSRLFIAFQIPYLSYDAYLTARQVESISTTGFPIFKDDLSFGGRTFYFSPLYYYILGIGDIFLSLTVAIKLFTNIFASLLIFVIYFIAKQLTDNIQTSLIASFISGFIPVYFSSTILSGSIYSIIIPLVFMQLYFLMNISNKKYVYLSVVLVIITALIHPSSLILIVTLLIYLLITFIEGFRKNNNEIEIILFSTFLVMWIYSLIYKKAFLVHGPAVIYQNIPSEIISRYFAEIGILDALLKIGLIPFIIGVYIVYKYLFTQKKKSLYLFISMALTSAILIWLRLIQPEVGLMFLGVSFTILVAEFCGLFFNYVEKMKFSNKKIFLSGLFILFFLSSIIPSFSYAFSEIRAAPSEQEIETLLWIKENTPENVTILSTSKEGFVVSYFSKRKNVMDSDYLLIDESDERYSDVKEIFVTDSPVKAVSLLTKYDVDYIYVSNHVKQLYGINKIEYIYPDCFETAYKNQGLRVYKLLCKVEEIR